MTVDHQVRYRDYPFDMVVAKAKTIIAEGHTVYQKFTCAGCGARLTCEPPNIFYERASCEKCKAFTNIRARGCNYMIVVGRPSP
jgi:hypothetical protein